MNGGPVGHRIVDQSGAGEIVQQFRRAADMERIAMSEQ